MGSLTLTQVLTGKKNKGFAHVGAVKVSTHVMLAKEEPKRPKAEEQKFIDEKKVNEQKPDEKKPNEKKTEESKTEKQRSKFKV